jgi:hypothetical protein
MRLRSMRRMIVHSTLRSPWVITALLYTKPKSRRKRRVSSAHVQETPIIMIWGWRVVRVVFHGDLLLLKGLY